MEDIREKMVNFIVKCGKELMAEKYNNSANNLTSPKLMEKALDDIFLHITEQINEYVCNSYDYVDEIDEIMEDYKDDYKVRYMMFWKIYEYNDDYGYDLPIKDYKDDYKKLSRMYAYIIVGECDEEICEKLKEFKPKICKIQLSQTINWSVYVMANTEEQARKMYCEELDAEVLWKHVAEERQKAIESQVFGFNENEPDIANIQLMK